MKNLFSVACSVLSCSCTRIVYGNRFKHLGIYTVIRGSTRIDGAKSIEIGSKSIIQKRSWLYAIGIDGIPCTLRIGNRCAIGYNNHITCVRDVEIGDGVLTANNVYISDNYHGYEDPDVPVRFQPVRFKGPTSIGEGSWLGENVCVIGARVGKHCVIGANSVVTKDIPDYCVAVGAPARIVKRYDLARREWLPENRGSERRGGAGV